MNAIIIEDEFLAARNLQAILKETHEIAVIAVLETIVETVEWLNCNRCPDIIFMDIHLADGSAFEIFEQIKINCPVIFTTAYDEYALRAFKVNSIDYLLKPINAGAVEKALQKLKTLISTGNLQNEMQKLIELLKIKRNYKTHFLVPTKADKLIPINVDKFAFIYIENSVIKVCTHDQKMYVLDFILDDLIHMLEPQMFFRANRQFIIARDAVKDIDLWYNNRLSINLKIPAPDKILISKIRVSEFKIWFTNQ